MKEDLKDIELFIDFCRAPYNFEHESDAKSYKELSNKIEHLIKAYKDLKEELETEQNERLLCHIREKQMIPVQKVEETIEELKDAKKSINKENWKYIYQMQINILQELLEKRK